jgi:hypothetical protein
LDGERFSAGLRSNYLVQCRRAQEHVGTSGSSSDRAAVVTANARSLPARMYIHRFRLRTFQSSSVEIVEKLNREINAGLADPKLRARLAALGGTMLPGSTADFGKFIADETEKWGKVVKLAGIKPD